jgi:superfamily II DNA/RNA helicase
LPQLQALGQKDSKREVFFQELRRITDDGRSVLVFTEYTDTMEYLRDSLQPFYNSTVACYSGDGGQIWDGDSWKRVTKADITAALKNRTIQVLLCTDAASEGLNLQAAGALVNYDLPWNPSKVEQRIGRIDRIGQKSEQVLVVNLFLEDSVDERVYQTLRARCGLFQHFVGAMQPVLALARRMLQGEHPVNPNALEAVASQVERDPLANETYLESQAASGEASPPHTLSRNFAVL